MLSIQEFKSNIDKYGTAYPSRFDITIIGQDKELSEILSARCEAASIPGIQITTTNSKLYGGLPDFSVPNGRKHDEVQLTFLETKDFKIKYYFEKWHKSITNMRNGQISYYDKINRDIIISMYSNESNVPTYTVKLIKAIPTRTELTTIDWSIHDEMYKLTVNIAYKDLQTDILTPFGVTEQVTSTIRFD